MAPPHQPFSELTNRTPSPSHGGDGRHSFRKHSPWTAARQKKKTRAVQQDDGGDEELHEPLAPPPPAGAGAAAGSSAAWFASPDMQVKTGCFNAIDPELSLTDCLSPPHGSPAASRRAGGAANVAQPCFDEPQQQEDASPDLAARLAAAATAAGGGSPASPMWFGCSSSGADAPPPPPQQQGEVQGAALAAGISSSAPAGALCDCFEAVQHQQQYQAGMCAEPLPLLLQQQQQAHAPMQAHPAAAAGQPGRRRGLVARRSNGHTVAEQCRLGAAAAICTLGLSRLAAAGSCAAALGGLQQQQPLHAAAAAGGFELRSRLDDDSSGWGCDGEQQLLQPASWPAAAGCGRLAAGLGASADGDAAADEAPEGSLEWIEAKLLEAAEEGDLPAAQQLWAAMQLGGVAPSLRVLNSYLMCCHYGGADPAEAEGVAREMCAAGGLEPNAMTARLLAAIDISWQQLHCAA